MFCTLAIYCWEGELFIIILNMQLLFSTTFWMYPLFANLYTNLLVWVFLAWWFVITCICTAASLKYGRQIAPVRRMYKKVRNYMIILFLCMIICVLGGASHTVVLTYRIYLLVILILLISFLALFVYQLKYVYPRDRERYLAYRERLKYLPRKNRRSQ